MLVNSSKFLSTRTEVSAHCMIGKDERRRQVWSNEKDTMIQEVGMSFEQIEVRGS